MVYVEQTTCRPKFLLRGPSNLLRRVQSLSAEPTLASLVADQKSLAQWGPSLADLADSVSINASWNRSEH